MRKVMVLFSTFIIFLQISGLTYGAIPAKERAALIAFYNAAGGDAWWRNTGWKAEPLELDGFGPIGSEGNWMGITVSGDHVTEIEMYEIHLNGHISPRLGDLDYLERLRLGGTIYVAVWQGMGGTIPPELGRLNNLKHLDLSFNWLGGYIPAELGNLSNLEYINLSNNMLAGIPPELGNLDRLKYIDLSSNQLTNIPPELGNLTTLEALVLNFCGLTGEIPAELGNLSNLKTLQLGLNQLTGSIPGELGNLSHLETLSLGNNNLSGPIPHWLGNLSHLEALSLRSNNLSGPIPHRLGNLENLQILDLSSNHLSGSIPAKLGSLKRISELYLEQNHLTGSIPPELGNLTGLLCLYLYSNKLTGNIPSTLINLINLQFTALDYNALFSEDEALKTFLEKTDDNWEETQTVAPTNIAAAAISSYAINVSWDPIVYTGDSGGYEVHYATTPDGSWTYAGMTPDKSVDTYVVTGLQLDTEYYFAVRTVTHLHPSNSNTVVSEFSEMVSAFTESVPNELDNPPIGFMDLPLESNTPLSGSIPICGWALDDVKVLGVKIYNIAGNSKIYLGTAVFVEGARPDIEQMYPQYPDNSKAGWGYMLLTNLLPNGGNGVYTFQAVAMDYSGQETVLGNKTIVCDNANAVKPFGAIDTPAQGGVASGAGYRNHGWVLTPMPNEIPTNGSTIEVYVDGVFLGSPVYNKPRVDIHSLFPGYNNSAGAGAYFDIDTTIYADGIHTIYWTAEDDAGNSDGIGSRYFLIQNTVSVRSNIAWQFDKDGTPSTSVVPDITRIPVDYSSPVTVIKGYDRNAEPSDVYPDPEAQGDDRGIITIEIRELERLVIRVFPEGTEELVPRYLGCQIVGDQIKVLPVGSTFDGEKGIFYWTPGHGFIGAYRFAFIEKEPDDETSMKKINVTIGPGKNSH